MKSFIVIAILYTICTASVGGDSESGTNSRSMSRSVDYTYLFFPLAVFGVIVIVLLIYGRRLCTKNRIIPSVPTVTSIHIVSSIGVDYAMPQLRPISSSASLTCISPTTRLPSVLTAPPPNYEDLFPDKKEISSLPCNQHHI